VAAWQPHQRDKVKEPSKYPASFLRRVSKTNPCLGDFFPNSLSPSTNSKGFDERLEGFGTVSLIEHEPLFLMRFDRFQARHSLHPGDSFYLDVRPHSVPDHGFTRPLLTLTGRGA
jgi:hypothetical protein